MTHAHRGDWLFDLGNSRLKVAPLHEGARVGPVAAHDTEGPDAPRIRAANGASEAGWNGRLPSGYRAWVSSVAAPARSHALVQALATRFVRVSIARTPRSFGGVRVAYADPARLGVDRFLAMLGARALGKGPWLLVGVGTALTLDLLDADGVHAGGRIAPSPALMREALHARAAHLPVHGGRCVAFADDTADALASGCEGAAHALVRDSLAAARTRLGRPVHLLLHGGGAPALAPALEDARLAPALVLQGLAAWACAGSAPG